MQYRNDFLTKEIAANIKEDFLTEDQFMIEGIEVIQTTQTLCHALAFASGWWHDLETGELKNRNTGELLMLIVSEIGEAMEGDRKNKMDEHLPHLTSLEVELADALIRIFDFAGAANLNLGRAMFEKLAYNQQRADHKIENRVKEDGKKY